MAKDKRKIFGAAGAVAAATAVGVAVARRKGEPATYHVRQQEEGWVVSRDGTDTPESTHGTKKDAISAARTLAGTRAPSTLILHYADGRVQKRISYEGDK